MYVTEGLQLGQSVETTVVKWQIHLFSSEPWAKGLALIILRVPPSALLVIRFPRGKSRFVVGLRSVYYGSYLIL